MSPLCLHLCLSYYGQRGCPGGITSDNIGLAEILLVLFTVTLTQKPFVDVEEKTVTMDLI